MTAAIRILHTEGRTVPWANGLGISRELILEQAASQEGLPQPLWRLATTRIGSDCPFSPCVGQDRIIVLLKGNGFELTHTSAKPQVVTDRFGTLHFNGDWGTSCRLLDGPVEVLNVMAWRKRITCSIEQLVVGEEPLSRRVTSASRAVFALDGVVSARLEGAELALEPGDALRLDIEAPGVVHLRAGSVPAHILFIETQRESFAA
jgi:uncharacterized protein